MTGTSLEPLAFEDTERIFSVLGQVGDPTLPLNLVERKRKLLDDVRQLIDADVYIWSAAIPDPQQPDVMTTQLLDGGWTSEGQRVQAYKALSSPLVNQTLAPFSIEAAQQMRHVTRLRSEILTDEWMQQHGQVWHLSGLDYSLFTIYPLSPTSYSGTGFHRLLGKPDFNKREQSIVHFTFKHVEWFHRRNVDPSHIKVLLLSPRERQTLILLLGGDTKREIAEKLGISEHTVGDYTKNIYKHFGVNSRGALQAFFMSGQSASSLSTAET
ncbi:Bacterial regulatory protein, luxR family [Anatilimnocola aggregata]|uniref:Bacterial regulatory protein, luxR family n=1 Tax=Anatilimnocola aggregata TaxID=2528021 RepID=A0A517YA80_9BACT|nr:helix-turn-helix transcriptional regulator [Anatilimnocola aggregata]QDU27124.1 Bacterial regulatory protein, luxR family [Anatilimnocola aggregata]